MKTVVGIDPSLTETGIAAVSQAKPQTRLHLVKSGPIPGGGTWDQRLRRINTIADEVVDFTQEQYPDLVVIEALPPNVKSTSGHDRSGVWWNIYNQLWSAGVPVLVATSSQRSKYGCGKGNAAKDVVLAAAIRRYLDITIVNNNIADAVILAAMGRRMLDCPMEDHIPQANRDALAKLVLPANLIGDLP